LARQKKTSRFGQFCTSLALATALTTAFIPGAVVAQDAAEAPASTSGGLAFGSRPNVLLIVVDDMGFTDLGVFGGEIATSNIDRLAARGTIFSNYYSAPLCAPTRAMLLTGTDHHRAGEGLMDRHVEGAPGYEGHLNESAVTVASRLRDAGYNTYMSGKWHLGREPADQPAARGFEHSFALLDGGGDHFEFKPASEGLKVQYSDDGAPFTELPDDFYSTVYFTDRMIGYLEDQPDRTEPFFAYLAYTAPHWPVQALDEDLALQKGKYDAGYEVLRQERFEAWKKLGIEQNTGLMPNLPTVYRPWNSLTPEEQARSSRIMEAYAAMISRLDIEIGRVLDHLEKSGQLDNTLIIFQSDNGAEGGGPLDPATTLEEAGRRGSVVSIGPEWAAASGAPHSMLKYFGNQGGVNVPAIISAPTLGAPIGRSDSLLVTYDVAPTLLELAGVDPSVAPRPGALSITGKSFLPLLQGNLTYVAHPATEVLAWEHAGQAAVRRGDWKLVWFDRGKGPTQRIVGQPVHASPAPTREALERGGPRGDPVGVGGPWRLYNVAEDPAELHDRSAEHPELVEELKAAWLDYAKRNQIIVKTGSDAQGSGGD